MRTTLRSAPVALVMATAAAALGATLRLSVHDVEPVQRLWAARRRVIYVAWHGRILLMPWISARLRRRFEAPRITALTSRSRDGALAAAFVERFGLGVVRGSSSRGGTIAARALVHALAAGDDVVVVPDGPRGPREQLQPGVVALAALTGAAIVPVGCAARPARRLSSWDAMLVPLPFARCAVVFGPPLEVARDADREIARKDAERALIEATLRADALVAR